MSIIIYAETQNGSYNKSAFELASYARSLADQMGETVTAVVVNPTDAKSIERYGVNKVLEVKNPSLSAFNASSFASLISQAAQTSKSSIVLLTTSADSKFLAPLLAVKLEASYASNVVALPTSLSPFTVKRTVFTNKAFGMTEMNTDKKIIALSKNAFGLSEHVVSAEVIPFEPTLSETTQKVAGIEKATDKVTIADADVVVSAGRGLKGPENWGMIEGLAEVLGAATACSKPVSDMGWRSHGEHVGQTGKPVAANLYIAIGISGAIQHLAGINSSKVKVVINTDPEAPFFKAADYGVVGDAFEVVPSLIEKLKIFKSQNS